MKSQSTMVEQQLQPNSRQTNPGGKMKAIVYLGDRNLVLQEVPMPEQRPMEAIVKVAAVGICGSELTAVVEPSEYRKPPLIMGHEFAGTRMDNGERVVVNPLIACGKCRWCDEELSHLCEKRAIIGINRPGAFAEYVSAPIASMVRLPNTMSWSQAALAEPMATAMHVMRAIKPERRSKIGIIGLGGIGMLVLLAAKARGFDAVEVAELLPARAAMAKESGASAVGRELSGDFDVIVDAVGTRATRRTSLTLLRRGGIAVWVGMHDDACQIDGVRDLIRRELSLAMCFAYTRKDFEAAVDLLAEVRTEGVVENVPFKDGTFAFERLLAGGVAAPKIQLVT